MWVAGLDMHTKMVGRISATRVRTLPLKGALHSCEAIFQNNRNLNIDKHYIHCQIFFAQQMFLCFIINSFNDKTIIAMGAAQGRLNSSEADGLAVGRQGRG